LTTQDHYDLILVGSGFATSFFLHAVLKGRSRFHRILVLEKGTHHTLDWQMDNGRVSAIDPQGEFSTRGLLNKTWDFNISLGGSSNGWWGCTPRMLPNDFALLSRYGMGYDWPLSYDELEPFYAQSERIMAISGPGDWALSHRSIPFPQPPHNMSRPDEILKDAYPDLYYPQASARARVATAKREECCAAARCSICPVDAKFSVINEMYHLFQDERVDLLTEAEVLQLGLTNDTVSWLDYRRDGTTHRVSGDLVVLGANAIFNPFLLLVSGDTHPLVGKRIHEQASAQVYLDLDGVDNFQGSTSITGQGFMFYDGEHRREYGACMTEHKNKIVALRSEFGKWRQRMEVKFIFEDLPLDENRVEVGEDGKPVVIFERNSDYSLRGIQQVPRYIEELGRHLPIEGVRYDQRFLEHGLPSSTEAHIQGTAVMSQNATEGVVDRNMVHHRYRNLVVAGGSAFPTSSPVNPTLTICALSLMSAEALVS